MVKYEVFGEIDLNGVLSKFIRSETTRKTRDENLNFIFPVCSRALLAL